MTHPHNTLYIVETNAGRVAYALRQAGYKVEEKQVKDRFAINVANDIDPANPNRVRDIINNTLIDDCEYCL